MAYVGPWRVVNSLTTLRVQLDTAFPGRSHASDGTIADDAHSTTSDHYPHRVSALGTTPVVTAFDGTHDPAHGLDNRTVCEAIRVSRDPRVKYVISNAQIFASYSTSSRPAWTWGTYTGSDDPHRTHFHVSVLDALIADSIRPWSIGVNMALTADERAVIDEIEQGSIVKRNALIYWIRCMVEGRNSAVSGGTWQDGSPQGPERDGIPELMEAILTVSQVDAAAVADALAANDVWTEKLADGIAERVGAKLGGVLTDVLNTATIAGTVHVPDE